MPLHAGEKVLDLRAVGDHVVGDEEAAGGEAGDRELEVRAVARAVGVEEDEVERPREGGQRVGGGAFPHLDPRGDPGPPEIVPREADLVRVALERDAGCPPVMASPYMLGRGAMAG